MPAIPPGPIVVDASALAPDASTIDLLARLQLTAARLGRRLLLRSVSTDLERLIDFAGLADVLRVEPRRQPEQREEPCRVEEERQLPDPPV
jgi:anti-anti-sigma regulatory factor